MLVGYARTSTTDQIAGLEEQERALLATGCNVEKLFTEHVSSLAVRPQLEAALEFVREGDVLCCTKLDRLCRSTADLLSIIAKLEAKGVGLRIMDFGGSGTIDTKSPTGRLLIVVLSAVAEVEVSMMKSRQLAGIARAKALGRYKGRQPLPPAKVAAVKALRASGKGASVIASEVGISRASVYRIVAEARQ